MKNPHFTNPYAVDGKCHNAEPGTYNHECGAPAEWLGVFPQINSPQPESAMGFCTKCKERGHDARSIVGWICLTENEGTSPCNT